MLRVENVTKAYGKTVANDNISFTVDSGRLQFCRSERRWKVHDN